MTDTGDLSRRIAEMALELETETSTQGILEAAVLLAVDAIDGCDAASISIVHRGAVLETPAPSSEVARHVDKLQYDKDEGPCISAVFDDDLISSPDLTAESRWRDWTEATVAETNVRSMLCFRLFTHERRVGALNLYAERPHAFSRDDIDLGRVFATHLAIATVDAQWRSNAQIAMDARTLIGQAQGILMERFDLDAGSAFAVLKRISQNGNRKLHDIALELVTTRAVPSQNSPGPED